MFLAKGILTTSAKNLFSLAKELNDVLLSPQSLYMILKETSGPIANVLKKSLQNKAAMITIMVRASDVLNKFLTYVASYESSKESLVRLMNKPADYDTIYSMYMNLQSMKVNLKMASILFNELVNIVTELKKNEPVADPGKIREAFNMGPKELILYLSKTKFTIEQASKILEKVRQVGGMNNVVNSYIKARIDEAYTLLLKLKALWDNLKNKYQREMSEFDRNLSLLRGG